MYFSTSKASILCAIFTFHTSPLNKHKDRWRKTVKDLWRPRQIVHFINDTPLCSGFPLGSIQMEHKYSHPWDQSKRSIHIHHTFFSKLLLTSSPILCLLSLPAIQSNYWMMLMKWHRFFILSMSLSHKSKQSDVVLKVLLTMKISHPLWRLILYWIYYLNMIL